MAARRNHPRFCRVIFLTSFIGRGPRRATAAVVATAVLAAACGGDATSTSGAAKPVDPAASGGTGAASGTFARIQSTVFTPSCAVSGCHVASSAAANGNLALTADVAYDNLVGATPSNLNARRDGLKRVVAGKPDSSLLFQKLVLALAAHNGDYGNMMPVGASPVTQGQVDYIRKWIEAGAPRTGDVADATLLANASAQSAGAFVPLAPPPAGQGYQVKVDSFGVQANFERELFVYRPLGNPATIYVNRIQTSMRPLSHHFVLYQSDPSTAPKGFPCIPPANTVRDIRNSDGSMNLANMLPMACHVFIGGGMSQTTDYVFPDGVALQMPASMSIDLNVHYVNRTNAEIPGEAYANLFTVPASAVSKVAHTLDWSNDAIVLPPKATTTLQRTFTVSQTTTIFMLTSHMHALGVEFDIQIVGGPRDGEVVYTSTDWEHPQIVTFRDPIVLQKGQGLRSVITWNNYTSQSVTFGLQSTDEMGIIFGYYY